MTSGMLLPMLMHISVAWLQVESNNRDGFRPRYHKKNYEQDFSWS
jgi:hypothetical protein